jgi:hypothetical protein
MISSAAPDDEYERSGGERHRNAPAGPETVLGGDLILVVGELVADVCEQLEERDPGIVDVVIGPAAHVRVKR